MIRIKRIYQPRPLIHRRLFNSSAYIQHDNPLGLPRQNTSPPNIPRRGGIPTKRNIPNVKKVVVVASGKGGVGKSTLAANLAMALASQKNRRRVGLLDLDLFGPSVPKLMGLESNDEPDLTPSGALVPLRNHGIPCMSMGFLLPPNQTSSSRDDTPVVWRGLMVQKAVQQLLFDVDWRERGNNGEFNGPGLDVLVVDMPPGTGDVPLTIGQLVNVDAAVIVSTPQDLAMSDVRKGIAMFRKLSVPISGLVLNTTYFLCSSCSTKHYLFGNTESIRKAARDLQIAVLGELPLVSLVSEGGDVGIPFMLSPDNGSHNEAEREWKNTMINVASHL